MSDRSGIQLYNFFIFNSLYGSVEGEVWVLDLKHNLHVNCALYLANKLLLTLLFNAGTQKDIVLLSSIT